MDANQNPPSERELTIEEREEFFKSQDAITGLPSPSLAANWHNGPALSPTDWDDLKPMLRRGIFITKITNPKHGWPIAYHCPICKQTTLLLSLWAEKPKDGDYWRISNICANEEHQARHNMIMALEPSHKKSVFG